MPRDTLRLYNNQTRASYPIYCPMWKHPLKLFFNGAKIFHDALYNFYADRFKLDFL